MIYVAIFINFIETFNINNIKYEFFTFKKIINNYAYIFIIF